MSRLNGYLKTILILFLLYFVIQSSLLIRDLLIQNTIPVQSQLFIRIINYISGGLILLIPILVYFYFTTEKTTITNIYSFISTIKKGDNYIIPEEDEEIISYAFLITVIIFFSYNGIVSLSELPSADGGVGDYSIPVLLVILIATFIIVAPLEELLYRGIIQNNLTELFDYRTSIIITSILFATSHVITLTEPLNEMIVSSGLLFFLSVVWGYAYYKSENILVPIIIHALYNLTIVLIVITQSII